MSDEIKACPFCGGEAWLYDANLDEGFNVPMAGGTLYVRCRAGCGHLRHTREEAIAAWNRRAPDPRLAAAERVVEAAKGIGLAFPCGERARELVDAIVAYDKLRAAP